MNRELVITDYSGEGVGGEVKGNSYSILILNFLERLAAVKIEDMQRHTETDESFILLKGSAVLFTSEGKEKPEIINPYKLEIGKVYTVPKGIWHTQSMTRDAKILLVESQGTVAENSPRCKLSEEQKAELRRWSEQLL